MQKTAYSRFALVLSLASLAGAAFATDPPVDYAALAGGVRTGVLDAIGVGAPVAFGLLAIMLGIGFVWRLVKRGAKSV